MSLRRLVTADLNDPTITASDWDRGPRGTPVNDGIDVGATHASPLRPYLHLSPGFLM